MNGTAEPTVYELACNGPKTHAYEIVVPPQYSVAQLQPAPRHCAFCGAEIIAARKRKGRAA